MESVTDIKTTLPTEATFGDRPLSPKASRLARFGGGSVMKWRLAFRETDNTSQSGNANSISKLRYCFTTCCVLARGGAFGSDVVSV